MKCIFFISTISALTLSLLLTGCPKNESGDLHDLCPAFVCSSHNLRLERTVGLPAKIRAIVDNRILLDECQSVAVDSSYRSGNLLFLAIGATNGELRSIVNLEVLDLKDCIQAPSQIVQKQYQNLRFPSAPAGSSCPDAICPILEFNI